MPDANPEPRTGVWQWLLAQGLERFELARNGDLWRLSGSIVALTESGSASVAYAIVCDAAWRTRQVDVALRSEDGERCLQVSAENGRWLENGRERRDLEGCLDIDLGWSPSTNTLPIRRLELAVGAGSGPLLAAWVRFPELRLEPLEQEYVRLAERRYRYSSRGGSFVAGIEVDADGLVLEYEGVWRRLGEGRHAAGALSSPGAGSGTCRS